MKAAPNGLGSITEAPRHREPSLPVVALMAGKLTPTLDAFAPRADRAFLDDCVAQHTRAVETLGKRATINHGGKIHPQYLASLIDHHADADAIFTADGGSAMVWLLRHVKANGKRRTLISLTHGTIGIFS
jgi:pyruvate dehydrogenase (quinone)